MKFDLTGYNVDNLLKTLYLKKITLTNIVRSGRDRVSFVVCEEDVRKVKRYIANFRVVSTLSIRKRLPKIMLANIGIIIGIIIGLILGGIATKFTWQIHIFGTEELSKTDIVRLLSDNDIKVGKVNTATSEEIEEILIQNCNQIAQVSVIRKGTAIIINLSEKLVYQIQKFQPIRAKYDGIITAVQVITGTVNVKVGDYVNKGDILVLPFNISSNGEKVSVRPIAEITAKMYIVGRSEISREETKLIRSGKTITEYKYNIFNFQLFRGKNKNSFALFDLVSYNENVSRLIPLKRDVYVYHELIPTIVTNDFDECRDALISESREIAYEDLPIGDILDESSEVRVVGDTMFAYTTIEILGNINDTN